jgi:hypothetical protein
MDEARYSISDLPVSRSFGAYSGDCARVITTDDSSSWSHNIDMFEIGWIESDGSYANENFVVENFGNGDCLYLDAIAR